MDTRPTRTTWQESCTFPLRLVFGSSTGENFTATINAYNAGTNYSNSVTGTVLQVNGGPNSSSGDQNHQNLITWGTVTPNVAGTPEPSSLAIAGSGALAFAGYGLRRRKAAQGSSPVCLPEPCECGAADSLPVVAS